MAHTRTTCVLRVATPRGERFVGLSFVGEGRRWGLVSREPREVFYRTRPHVHPNLAFEEARDRTVHHNLWHDGSEGAARIASLHRSGDCHERGSR